MKPVHITIDSRDAKHTTIAIVGDGYEEILANNTMQTHSQVILPLIEEALKKHAATLADITNITVLVDHGSFTGRRVGVTIAQTLGLLLHVPVNGKPAESPIDIHYEEDKWK